MPREGHTLAILFADLANSTRLYEVLGDETARELIARCLSHLSRVARTYDGTVIKTIGDEIMCTFPTAMDAIQAGKAMHEALEDMPMDGIPVPGFTSPNIYVGIQYGPVIWESRDVFGEAVNMAAKMAALAKQRQIITTEETIDAMPRSHGFDIRCVGQTTARGQNKPMAVYEVIWEDQDITLTLLAGDPDEEPPAAKRTMALKFGNQTVRVNDLNPSVTLGRQIHNDLVVNNNRVSRSHARIEFRQGKFFLVDQSTNGTYALIQGGKKLVLRQNESILSEDGVIGLGRAVTPDTSLAIHYTITN